MNINDYKQRAGLLALLMISCLCLLLAGCGKTSQKQVDLIFSHEPDRWLQGAQSMKEQLESDGAAVNLIIFSTDEEQKAAIDQAVAEKPDCIVLAGGDIKNLRAGLDKAKQEGIPVIDYDGLTQDTDAIAYYVTFDNYGVGEAMGKYIEQKFQLAGGAGPFNVEFFSGSDTDSNARLMYQGAYDVLKPYFDNGQLKVPSGQLDYQQNAIKDWSGKNAQARMEELVTKYYSGGNNLDIVIAASDGIAYGVIDGLQAYQGRWPFITGQDADKKALEYIRSGRMAFSIKKSSEVLNQKCIRMIKAVVDGSAPEINDTTTYNNGQITVPSYLCVPRIIDKENIDSAS